MLLCNTDEILSHGQLVGVAQIVDHSPGKFQGGSSIHLPSKIFSDSYLRYFRFQNWVLCIKRLLPYEARQYNLLGLENILGENVSAT